MHFSLLLVLLPLHFFLSAFDKSPPTSAEEASASLRGKKKVRFLALLCLQKRLGTKKVERVNFFFRSASSFFYFLCALTLARVGEKSGKNGVFNSIHCTVLVEEKRNCTAIITRSRPSSLYPPRHAACSVRKKKKRLRGN